MGWVRGWGRKIALVRTRLSELLRWEMSWYRPSVGGKEVRFGG